LLQCQLTPVKSRLVSFGATDWSPEVGCRAAPWQAWWPSRALSLSSQRFVGQMGSVLVRPPALSSSHILRNFRSLNRAYSTLHALPRMFTCHLRYIGMMIRPGRAPGKASLYSTDKVHPHRLQCTPPGHPDAETDQSTWPYRYVRPSDYCCTPVGIAEMPSVVRRH